MNALTERQGRGWIPGKKRSAKGSGELFPLVEQQYEITIRAIREYEAALPQNPAEWNKFVYRIKEETLYVKQDVWRLLHGKYRSRQ